MQEAQIVLDRLQAMWQARCLQAAAEFNIADHLKDGPRSTQELAALTRTHEPSLYRLLRALASEGFFSEVGPRLFANTALSTYLRSDVPGSLHAMALFLADETNWHQWAALPYSIRTGQPAFDALYKMPVWQYFEEHPQVGEIFNRFMANVSVMFDQAVTTAYDFASVTTLVDVGGGYGSLLNAILTAFPQIQTGILFDQVSVIEKLHAHKAEVSLDSRCQIVSGDFLQQVPSGGDLYVLKAVLHDWPDEEVITILKNCRRHMQPYGKVLVCEQLILPGTQGTSTKYLDLAMMLIQQGRERTQEEFGALYEAAGLKLTRVIPTGSLYWLLEGVPVAQPGEA